MIDSGSSFEHFYDTCANLSFSSSLSHEKVWEKYTMQKQQNFAFLLITAAVTKELQNKLEEHEKSGSEVVLIDIGELFL